LQAAPVLKPVSDLEKYLAGEFADELDFLNLDDAERREPQRGEASDACPFRKLLAPFTQKGS
jgi:hypothetical protein